MTVVDTLPVLHALEAAAGHAETAERQYRQEAAQRIAALEQERAFAYRRLGLVRTLSAAMIGAEDEPVAVASGLAVLREKLGWATDSEARDEVATRFAPVLEALFRALTGEDEPDPSPQAALADFEGWYVESRGTPFWSLFDRYMPETPLVDF